MPASSVTSSSRSDSFVAPRPKCRWYVVLDLVNCGCDPSEGEFHPGRTGDKAEHSHCKNYGRMQAKARGMSCEEYFVQFQANKKDEQKDFHTGLIAYLAIKKERGGQVRISLKEVGLRSELSRETSSSVQVDDIVGNIWPNDVFKRVKGRDLLPDEYTTIEVIKTDISSLSIKKVFFFGGVLLK